MSSLHALAASDSFNQVNMAPVVPEEDNSDEENDDVLSTVRSLLPLPSSSDDEDDQEVQEPPLPPPSKVSTVAAKLELQLQNHYLSSVDSTVVVRQLPAEGLSFQLWPAATTLVNLIDGYRRDPSHSPLAPTVSPFSATGRRLRILEIGSGTGLVGIAAAVILGAEVTVTDLPHVIPNLKFNAEANADVAALNGGSVHVATLRWGETDDVETLGREFDIILGSDVVYYDHLYDPLLKTVRLLFEGEGNENMVFVMAHLRRWKKDSVFFKRAKKMFQVEVLHVDNPLEGSRTGVVVYQFSGKSPKANGGSAGV